MTCAPQVSAIVPVRDRAWCLGRAIRRILRGPVPRPVPQCEDPLKSLDTAPQMSR